MSNTKTCPMCSRNFHRGPASCEHNWRTRKFCGDECSNASAQAEKKRRDEMRGSVPAALLERDHTGAIRAGHPVAWGALDVGITWEKAGARTHHMGGR